MQSFIHRMNQTAHISLQILSMSKSAEPRQKPKLQRQNQPAALKLLSATRLIYLNFSYRPSLQSLAPQRRLASRCAPQRPPVRGVLRLSPNTRNPFLQKIWKFSAFFSCPLNLPNKNNILETSKTQHSLRCSIWFIGFDPFFARIRESLADSAAKRPGIPGLRVNRVCFSSLRLFQGAAYRPPGPTHLRNRGWRVCRKNKRTGADFRMLPSAKVASICIW